MAYDAGNFKGPGGVNVAEVLRAADLVESVPPEEFDMANYCGTACCIAGHVLRDSAVPADKIAGKWDVAAAAILGLSEDQRLNLFAPAGVVHTVDCFAKRGEPGFITNAHAAACLRKLAATGEVDWLGTKPAS